MVTHIKKKPKVKTKKKGALKTAEPKLKIVYRKVADLVPYAHNARTHTEDQIQQIMDSMKRFNWTVPILIDPDDSITAGHGRVLAAQRLGMVSIPTISKSFKSEADRRAYVIVDNQIGLNADWDFDTLRDELEFLKDENFDLDLIGFDDAELTSIFHEPDFPPAKKEEQSKLGEKTIITCPECGCDFKR